MRDDAPSGLPSDFTLETVDLAVSDVDRARSFYEQVVGLEAWTTPADGLVNRDAAEGTSAGTAPGTAPGTTPETAGETDPELVIGRAGRPIVRLRGTSPVTLPGSDATGLFHLAVLLPSRADLADFVAALVAARTPVVGVADHGVSEAIYLEDPDGHGVEVYADRPRDAWPMRAGRLAMTTDPLAVDGLLAEAAWKPGQDGDRLWSAPSGTRLGHVHLRVRDVDEAGAFYRDVVGFDEVASLPGASFLSVGGYHHHLGVNAWQSSGGSPMGPGAPRLERVRASVGSSDALRALRARLGPAASESAAPWTAAFRDPSGVAWQVFVRDRSSR